MNEPAKKITRITDKKPSTVKLYRANKALWVENYISGRIMEFVEKLALPGVTYDAMSVYLKNTTQYAQNLVPKGYIPPREFTIACDIESNEPLGFVHWLVCGLPHISTTFMDQLYIWEGRKGEVASALIGRWAAFAKKHKCEIFIGCCIDEAVFRLARKEVQKRGYKFIESSQRVFYAIKEVSKNE